MATCIARRVVFILFALVTVGVPSLGHAAAGDCGQPVSQGNLPTATDALFTLQAAVGAGTCAPALCDVDGSCIVTATDALRVLSRAVGQADTLDCSCMVSTTTSSTTVTSTSTTSTTLPVTTSTSLTSTTATTVPPSTTTTTMPPGVRLHFENVTAQSMELWIDTDLCVNGYQFTVSGATVAGAGGGLTQAAGLSISTGPTLVLVTPPGTSQQIVAGSNGQLLAVLLSDTSAFVCAGAWAISDCNSIAVPASAVYFRRVDGSLCRSNDPGCFLCNF